MPRPLPPAARPQGTFLGMPYDFRVPTVERWKARMWSPGGPMLMPHLFGWGYTFNLAHPGTWALTSAVLFVALLSQVVA